MNARGSTCDWAPGLQPLGGYAEVSAKHGSRWAWGLKRRRRRIRGRRREEFLGEEVGRFNELLLKTNGEHLDGVLLHKYFSEVLWLVAGTFSLPDFWSIGSHTWP